MRCDASLGALTPSAEGEPRWRTWRQPAAALLMAPCVVTISCVSSSFPFLSLLAQQCPSHHLRSRWSLSSPPGNLSSCVSVPKAGGAAGIGSETSVTPQLEKRKAESKYFCSKGSEAEGAGEAEASSDQYKEGTGLGTVLSGQLPTSDSSSPASPGVFTQVPTGVLGAADKSKTMQK